jgi:hypothetical protein|tara:strand:+ start:3040 stop:3396 length:357 start_codon:yes stop_codon:yes gene_type:complete
MKLTLVHLLLITVLAILLSTLGYTIKEGLTSGKKSRRKKKKSDYDDDDEYILKSQIVPPVCPKCPDSRSCPRPKPCPACPPCARCPEPSFECKKVPNYNSSNVGNQLPTPLVNDYTDF